MFRQEAEAAGEHLSSKVITIGDTSRARCLLMNIFHLLLGHVEYQITGNVTTYDRSFHNMGGNPVLKYRLFHVLIQLSEDNNCYMALD